ncbi:MAG: DUF120 domain-containing protein [Candidatus Verstraetearchaeota archaeon]|nr:DUF120 domain-containing protein [Candidatus Verstraetearchaeota archaeon]
MKADSLWFALLELAKRGALHQPVFLSTTELGRAMRISQQTASRRLQELARLGYVQREVSRRGEYVSITEKGARFLEDVYFSLKAVFEEYPKTIELKGYVFTGMGEGAYYVSLPEYMKQFAEKLGFRPFPGTLNLRLASQHDIRNRRLLEASPGILIKGFYNGLRTYGDVKCFKAKVNGEVVSAVIFAMRTHYGEDVIEVIAPEKLRERLKLKDGDLVVVQVLISQPSSEQLSPRSP